MALAKFRWKGKLMGQGFMLTWFLDRVAIVLLLDFFATAMGIAYVEI